MKAFRCASFAFLRSPLLSFGEFRAQGGEDLAQRTGHLRAFLEENRALQDALSVASPALLDALSPGAPRRETAVLAAMRYLERMRGRSTPFGLCAGYSIASATSGETFSANVLLRERGEYEHHRRVDADSVETFAKSIPDRFDVLVTNACLFRRGSNYELLRRADGLSTQYEVQITPAIDALIEFCQAPQNKKDCLSFLAHFEEDLSAREAFLHTLAEAEILIPAASAILTTDDELHVLGPCRSQLAPQGRLRTLASEAFEPFPDGIGTIHDLVKPAELATITLDLGALTKVLSALSGSFPKSRDERLVEFRRWLIDRYDFAAAPLLEALDPEGGFVFDTVEEKKRPLDAWMLEALPKVWMNREKEWRLRSADLPRGEVADSGLILFQHTTVGFAFQAYISGPGTQLFARAAGFSKRTRELSEEWIAELAANAPDEKWADIAFFPPGKSAAFTQFPTLTPWEITIAPRSDIEASRRIDINDLWVAPGPADSVVVFQGSTGQIVRPKICGAVNPNRPDVPGFVRFLHGLCHHESGRGAAWTWGPLTESPYLPRVSIDGLIVAPQRWRLSKLEIEEMRNNGVHQVRTLRGLPRFVAYHESADLVLPVDLDDALSVAAFLDIAKQAATLVEQLEPAGVRGPEGDFAHEFAVPITCHSPAPVSASSPPSAAPGGRASAPKAKLRLQRHSASSRVLPGSDVLFFKVYGTHEALHEALCERIAPFLNEQLAKRSLRNWFYLPFSDPHPHLRIRLFGDPSYLTSLLGEFHEGLEDFFERRELWKLSIDTYDRETNRYGGAETLAICEEIFGLSSRESLAGYSNFHECGDSESAAIRALAASQERFLASVSDSIEEALDLAKFAFSRFNRETREEVLRAESEMSALFREERKEGVSPFSDASAEIREKISHLRSVCSTPNLKEIIADLLHVHSIRVCTTWPHCVGAEARGYLYLERRLAMLVALKRKGMR